MKYKKRTAYIATKHGILNNTQAEVAGRELSRIQAQHGCIKPQTVVDESPPEKAPLHPHFTWDDGVAAEKCRIEEARAIIRSVRIVDATIPSAEQPEIRAFVNVVAHHEESTFQGQAYISEDRARSDDDYRSQVVTRAMDELRLWQRRYEDYKDYFAPVFRAIDNVDISTAPINASPNPSH